MYKGGCFVDSCSVVPSFNLIVPIRLCRGIYDKINLQNSYNTGHYCS